METDYTLINKTVFFPKQGILAFGDVHLGYDKMLQEQGIIFPFNQLEQSIDNLKQVVNKIKSQGHKIKKIIILGDLKHYFSFKAEEKFEIRNFLDFIDKNITKNIILIKGNHERFELGNKKYIDFHIEPEIQTAFIHGDKEFPDVFNKNISIIVMTHLHTAVYLKDKNSPKKEKYKVYLTGKYKNKNIIILPSFFPLIEGAQANLNFYEGDFSIIPKTKLQNFKVHIIGKDKIYEFGRLKEMIKF